MWYTRKGDGGSTKTLREKSGARISKSSCATEALGALDELNSFLGFVKVKALALPVEVGGTPLAEVLHEVQNNLFTAQAEVAGADKRLAAAKVKAVETLVDTLEKKVPKVSSFCIPGGVPKGRGSPARELAALLDSARALARRAERRVVLGVEKREIRISADTLAYLNRLSSLLYALVRFLHHRASVPESAPTYK